LALAVTTPTRSTALPDIPALAETLKNFSVDTWWGLVAPAGTPPAVVQRLNQSFVQALNASDTKTRFAKLMAEPMPTSPAAFGQLIASELSKYEAVVKASGARAD
jgi:tripartite-type tricarboxylate transporter receptor subunit TctC